MNEAAKEALLTIGKTKALKMASLVETFANTVKEHDPDMTFSSGELYKWIQAYCEAVEEDIPSEALNVYAVGKYLSKQEGSKDFKFTVVGSYGNRKIFALNPDPELEEN